MTVPAIYVPDKYNVTTGQLDFNISFDFVAAAHIRATMTDSVGVDTELTNGVDFSVVGTTLTTALQQTIGDKLTIWLEMPFTQLTDYKNTGDLDLEVVENDYDIAALERQQLLDDIRRAVKAPITGDADGDDLLADLEALILAGSQAGIIIKTDSFVGDGSTVDFTLTVQPLNSDSMIVVAGGVLQNPGAYSVSGYVLTLTEAPGDDVVITARNIGYQRGYITGSNYVKYLSNYASWEAAETAIGSAECTLVVDIAYPLTGAFNIPTNVSLIWLQGCTVSGAFTFTINGSLEAGNYQIFDSTVTVTGLEEAYPEWFGAVADGAVDNAVSIQAAVDSGAKRVNFQRGTYYSSVTIRLAHSGSYYRNDTGQHLFGTGVSTILTRQAATEIASVAESAYQNEAFFSIHGSHNTLSGFMFNQCRIGVYFGQDPRVNPATELSSTCKNKLTDLIFYGCGTAIMSSYAEGHHYNYMVNIHMQQCQIGVYYTNSTSAGTAVDNNNRNTFLHVKASRCQVGLWIEYGDTNEAYSFPCEGCGVSPTGNSYPAPTTLPGVITNSAFIIEGSNNTFYGCVHESCDHYIYHDATFTQAFGCTFRLTTDPSKQTLVTNFWNYHDRYNALMAGGAFSYAWNASTFPGIPEGRNVNGGLGIDVSTISELLSIGDGAVAFQDDLTASAVGGTHPRIFRYSGGQLFLQAKASQDIYLINASGSTIAKFEGNTLDAQFNNMVKAPAVYAHDMNGETMRDLQINDAGELGYDSSAERGKMGIIDIPDTGWIHKLRPVEYEPKKKEEYISGVTEIETEIEDGTDGDGKPKFKKVKEQIEVKKKRYIKEGVGWKQNGLVAEEVDQVNPDLIFRHPDGAIAGVHYGKQLIIGLLSEVQKLKKQIDGLQK
jgi:hypothetical protein